MTVPSPPVELRRSLIDSMFVVLYARDDATRSLLETMAVTTAEGAKVYGSEAASAVLVDTLAAAPEAFAQWLADSEQLKLATSLSIALNHHLRAVLAERTSNSALFTVLGEADRSQARDQSMYLDPQPTIVDLREPKAVATR